MCRNYTFLAHHRTTVAILTVNDAAHIVAVGALRASAATTVSTQELEEKLLSLIEPRPKWILLY